MAEKRQQPMRSGELARWTGVSRDSLRYYERMHLLPAPQRSQNGYRHYPPEAIKRVQMIRAALSIGFTVEELSEIFQSRDRGQVPCSRVHALALEKAGALEKRIAEINELQRALRSAIREWSRKLKATAPGQPAGLLEIFATKHPESLRAISPLISPGLKQKLQRKQGGKR